MGKFRPKEFPGHKSVERVIEMTQAAKIPELASALREFTGKEDEQGSQVTSHDAAAALVEDFVAERAITALDLLLDLARGEGGETPSKAAALAHDLPRDTQLLHNEVSRFLELAPR